MFNWLTKRFKHKPMAGPIEPVSETFSRRHQFEPTMIVMPEQHRDYRMPHRPNYPPIIVPTHNRLEDTRRGIADDEDNGPSIVQTVAATMILNDLFNSSGAPLGTTLEPETFTGGGGDMGGAGASGSWGDDSKTPDPQPEEPVAADDNNNNNSNDDSGNNNDSGSSSDDSSSSSSSDDNS